MRSVNGLFFNISTDDFLEAYQGKKPLLMRGAVSTKDVSWRDVNEIVARRDVASDDFKLSFDRILPKHEYVESYFDIGVIRHRLIKPVVYDYLRNGATLIANKIKNEPFISRYERLISELTGRQVVSSAYAAFGSKDSFRCHWDTRDVFAVQLIGRKRWIIYEPSLECPLYTQQSKDYEHEYPCPAEPYMDFILEAGDVFYLPRGWWHNPLPLGEATFHLAFGTFPAYMIDYLSWMIKQMPGFVGARRSLAGWGADQGDLASVAQYISDFIAAPENYHCFMDEFVGAIRTDSSIAMEILGDPSCAVVPDSAGVRLCDSRIYGLESSYVLVNGAKLKLDEQALRLITFIAHQPGVRLEVLLENFPETGVDKLRQLITELCRQDILELIHY